MIEAEIVIRGRNGRASWGHGSRFSISGLSQNRLGTKDEIAALFELSSRQVDAAICYIEEHPRRGDDGVRRDPGVMRGGIRPSFVASSRPRTSVCKRWSGNEIT